MSEQEATRIAAKGKSEYFIVREAKISESDEPLDFAAEELQRHLELISKVCIPIRNEKTLPEHCLILWHADDDLNAICSKAQSETVSLPEDAFVMKTVDSSILLGGTYRGVLYAVYSFLEKLGCRWYTPGPDGEIMPKKEVIAVEPLNVREVPSFRRRGFAEDASHVFGDAHWERIQIEEDRAFLDWLAKNRINHCHHFAEELSDELRKRGFLISSAYGETLITRLLSRALFKEHPEYFRMDSSGRRVPSGNMCVSDDEAMKVVVENAVKYARRHPEVFSARISTQDIWGGGWCHCENCRDLTPQDQYVTVTNAIAKAWEAANIRTKALNVPYRDTLEARLNIRPDDRTLFEFHPRERCYAHALNDPHCERNWWYRHNLEAWIQAIGKAEMDILGYYGDCILFNSLPIHLTKVIAQDMRYYKKIAGGAGVSYLLMGKYCWWAYPLNMYLFARMSWDANLQPEIVLDDYFRGLYGEVADLMKKYLSKLENAMANLVTYTEPIMDAPQTYDPFIEKLFFLVRESLRLLTECQATLVTVEQRSLPEKVRTKVQKERLMLEFTRKQTEALLHHLQGLYWLALADQEDLEKRAMKGPITKVPVQERYHQEMWGEVPKPYALAKKELGKALSEYKDVLSFVEALPQELGSSWLATDFGFRRTTLLLNNILQLKIEKCEEALRKSGGVKG